MTMQRRSMSSWRRVLRRVAYSRAASGSWMEQGPTITKSRWSSLRRIRRMAARPSTTVRCVTSVMGSSAFKARGGGNGDRSRMGRSWGAGSGLLSQKKASDFHQGLAVWIDRRVPLQLAPGVEGVKIKIAVRGSQIHCLNHLLAGSSVLKKLMQYRI